MFQLPLVNQTLTRCFTSNGIENLDNSVGKITVLGTWFVATIPLQRFRFVGDPRGFQCVVTMQPPVDIRKDCGDTQHQGNLVSPNVAVFKGGTVAGGPDNF